MSDIDEIALETVKAIGNIDPDRLPGGKTQAIAQAQILVRDAIESQLTTTQAENEALRARVAELSELVLEARDLFDDIVDGSYKPDSFTSQPYRFAMMKDNSRSWLLRKQAEAVEAATNEHEIKSATDDSKCYSVALRGYAKRLRQQAYEAERAG